MIPISLDPGQVRIGLVGRGESLRRRLAMLGAGRAQHLAVFSDEAGDGLPTADDLAALDLLWIAGLPQTLAAELVATARAHRVLVNVEDQPALCDFHSVAELRRGDLLITVSTVITSDSLCRRYAAGDR